MGASQNGDSASLRHERVAAYSDAVFSRGVQCGDHAAFDRDDYDEYDNDIFNQKKKITCTNFY